jgi:protein SCO1/2
MSPRQFRTSLVASCVLAIAAIGCTREWRSTDVSATRSDSLFGYPWQWTDDGDRRVTLSRWRGTPIILTAIFTSCHETCPRTLARLHRLQREYELEGRRVEFVLVTLDPVNDTPERLRAFKREQGFPDTWHMLRGDVEQVRQVADLLGMHVMDMDSHVVHESRIVVFDEQGMRQVELAL